MSPEQLRIRITKDGEVWVDLRGLTEKRVREIRRMLEEVIGPVVKEVGFDPTGPGPAVRFLTDEEEHRFRLGRG